MSKIGEVTQVNKDSIMVDTGGGTSFECDLFLAPGEDSKPIVGDRVAVMPVNGERLAVAYYDSNIGLCESGEKRIYSRDADNNIKGEVFLKKDGSINVTGENINLNGNDKRFVTHAELDAALQLFMTALNTHTHLVAALPSAPPVLPIPTLIPTVPLSIDISASKTLTVKTGG